MVKILAIARHELTLNIQNRRFWVFLFVLPVLTIALVGFGTQEIASLIPSTYRMDILDQDNSPASIQFIMDLAVANPSLVVCPLAGDADCDLTDESLSPPLALTRLKNETAYGTVTFSSGFGEGLQSGERIELTFQPGAGKAVPEILFTALRAQAVKTGGPSLAARMSTEFMDALDLPTIDGFFTERLSVATNYWALPNHVAVNTSTARPDKGQIMGLQLVENGFKLSATSMTAMFVMISIFGMANSFAESRSLGVYPRIGMMPVSKLEFLAGHFLVISGVGLAQLILLVSFGTLFGVSFGDFPGAVLAVGTAYVLGVTALGIFLVQNVKTPLQAHALTTAAWGILVPLGGGWWPLEYVPEWLQTVGHTSPIAWVLDAFNDLIFFGGSPADVVKPSLVNLGFALVFFSLSLSRFRFKDK